MKKIKKFLMYFLLVIVVLVLVAIFPALFYKKSVNDTPLPPYYKKGAYHMHSVFSDGKGTIEEITAAGASVDSGLDFLILTDHGEPNRKSSNATAYKNNVLLIGGSEFSLNCGHLAAVGYKLPDYIFPPEPQEAIDEVTGDGGVCFISHPFDDHIPWSDWDVNGFTGLEVLSSYSAARKISFLRLLAFPFQYTVDSKYALTGALNFPHENLEKWHALNLNSRFSYYGIYALDTHAKLPITSNFQLNFPTYQSMFEILTVYVNVDKVQDKDPIHAKASIISALRKGRFFNVIESIAAANGFEAYFTEPTGNRVEMGGFSGSANGKLSILTPFPFDTDVVIKKDGKLFKRFAGNKKDRLEIVISDSGSYIIEVYVPDNTFSELPWILSNPFFIGNRSVPTGLDAKNNTGVVLKKYLAAEKGFFHVEKNTASMGKLSYMTDKNLEKNNPEGSKLEHRDTEVAELVSILDFNLTKSPGEKDFWAALASRKRFDFSDATGFIFEVRSDSKRRVWLEFRTGEKKGNEKGQEKVGNESWYRHSFLVDDEWSCIHIPFNKFYLFFGENKPPVLSDIHSLFFSINNSNAYAGSAGTFRLRNFGIY